MAIYHLSIKIITRGKGKSAVAAAAYRAAELIRSEYDGKTNDYTRKGGVVHTEILLPEHAPPEYADRCVLWNAVEKIEKQKNSQLSREIEIALPAELSTEQNISLARRYAKEQFVSAGMCADVCVHDKGDGNPHAHIMLTMRPIREDGAWGAKVVKIDKKRTETTDWNGRDKAEQWRRAWAAYANTALHIAGVQTEDNILDHRSYERQGAEQIPTIHLGVAASQMERKGIRTDRGDINREIAVTNSQIRRLRARINRVKDWLKTESENTAPPTLTDVITEILNHREGASRYGKIADLKAAAKVLNFLTENHITDMAVLNAKVSGMNAQLYGVGDKLKKVERRLNTLDEHIRHSENFKNNRGHRARYEKLYAEYETAKKTKGFFSERKAQKALDAARDYYEANRAEITLCDAAERYLRDVLQGRFDAKKLPPITKWKDERAAKTAEKSVLYADYRKLKDEVGRVETVKRNAEKILGRDEPKPDRLKRAKTRDMER
ncbi:MAG: MobA/MobL family protein [Oscillospiraceae bacterium]|nr:MobA/MobL family protein [Oscillospiraceae bacterium]